MDRRDFLKKIFQLSAVAGGVALGHLSGCDRYADNYGYYQNLYDDYPDGYSNGYGDGYGDYQNGYANTYDDYPEGYAPQDHLPEPLKQRTFYTPSDRGFEKTIGERIRYWRRLKREIKRPPEAEKDRDRSR